MKTFDDLEFETHPMGIGKQAKLKFGNGYGISVASGDRFFIDQENPYELTIFKKTKDDWHLDYDHPEAQGDVRGYLTEEDVTRIMKSIQETKSEE